MRIILIIILIEFILCRVRYVRVEAFCRIAGLSVAAPHYPDEHACRQQQYRQQEQEECLAELQPAFADGDFGVGRFAALDLDGIFAAREVAEALHGVRIVLDEFAVFAPYGHLAVAEAVCIAEDDYPLAASLCRALQGHGSGVAAFAFTGGGVACRCDLVDVGLLCFDPYALAVGAEQGRRPEGPVFVEVESRACRHRDVEPGIGEVLLEFWHDRGCRLRGFGHYEVGAEIFGRLYEQPVAEPYPELFEQRVHDLSAACVGHDEQVAAALHEAVDGLHLALVVGACHVGDDGYVDVVGDPVSLREIDIHDVESHRFERVALVFARGEGVVVAVGISRASRFL